MGKVICMFTRKDVTNEPLPVSKEAGEQLIMDLFEVELKRASNPFSANSELIDGLIRMVENNTGASRYDVMDRFYTERKA
ncbi:MAG: hypothetical protein HC840_00455 [Leptolyngbyaceae cyanobacterium RM2_2_4]|nr:hypothetical protein [Leptolyngbyaceae cyanobacterium RM2_2_4]